MDKDLLKYINNCDYVSFDIFDTAIKRKRLFKPEDLFKFIERKANRFYKKNILQNFRHERLLAEDQARKIFTDNEEITLDQIYYCLNKSLNLSDEIIEKIKDIEVQTEKRFCKRDNFIFDIYNYCLNENKKIIFLSDMYISKDIISEILTKNGYKKFHNLVISSETGFTKFTGNQYNYLIKILDTSPDKILHIGDNYATDIINAQKNGLNTFFYDSSKIKNACFLKHSSVKANINLFIKEHRNQTICFYGAGQFAGEFLKHYDVSDLNILGFIDRDSAKKDQKIYNYKIYSPEDIEVLNPDIIALTMLQKTNVLKFLNKYKNERNLDFDIVQDLFISE